MVGPVLFFDHFGRCEVQRLLPSVDARMVGPFIFFDHFFFQAEDGIRDYKVTGVQTCALPILVRPCSLNCSISAQSWRRACGSRPVVGSSRNRKSGSPTRAQASASRCFCPPERPPTRAFIFSSSCTSAITSDGGGPCRKKLRNKRIVSSTVTLSASCVSWS